MFQSRVTALGAVVIVEAIAVGGGVASATVHSASAMRTTSVKMSDFAFKPAHLSATGGRLRVTATNKGKMSHEFVLIRTKRAANALPMKGKRASEAGAVGEIPEQKPGRHASHVFKIKPGRYVYLCNVPGHYKAGMYGTLTVK
jgi:uncharacterized cupredoxin-like copper-binding protein